MNSSTNRKLIRGYARLIKKGTQRITVSLLCEKADVARATFYIHYKDLNDFTETLQAQIVDKFFEQATFFLSCDDKEFQKAIKKENLLLNENELTVLENMISGTNYIDFLYKADKYYIEEKEFSLFTKEEWLLHEDKINIFSRGYLPLLILGITNYFDEKEFRSDMENCRKFYKRLRSYIVESAI